MMPATKIDLTECSAEQHVTKAKIEISLKNISLATDQYIILCARNQVSDPGP